jgi:hypothetical protein
MYEEGEDEEGGGGGGGGPYESDSWVPPPTPEHGKPPDKRILDRLPILS